MSRPNCVIWVDKPDAYREALGRAGVLDRIDLRCVPRDEPMPDDVAAHAEIVAAWKPGPWLARASRLRWIQAMTAGVEAWLAAPGLRDDVLLSCARGSHRDSMPENILGALFHITKPYMAAALDQRVRRWTRRQADTLAGRTLGILGLGAIGKDLARRAAAIDMRVVGTKRIVEPVPHVERVHPPEAIDQVLGASDFVVLLMPATPDTVDIMDARRLARMKPTAWLLNFGRGALVVDQDLVEAVKAGTIAGAVLDVFRKEPLPSEHPFWDTEGILVLPHVGGGHPQRGALVAEIFAANLVRYLAGEPLDTGVDRLRGY